MPEDDAQRIPPLLESATLMTGEYHPGLGELWLAFSCLRRHVDGSTMTDHTVTLRLVGVTEVVVAYDPTWPEDRPSEFRLREDVRIRGLAPWPLPQVEPLLTIDSAASEETLELAAYRETLVGTGLEAGRRLVCIHASLGVPCVPTLLAIRCSAVRPYSGGRPLPLDTWEAEFGAWWTGLREYWDSEHAKRKPAAEDASIPAGSNERLDRSYSPPQEPPFGVAAHDAPPELVTPVRTWFEAGLVLDAAKRVSVEPDIDTSTEEQVEIMHELMWGDEFGAWEYACEIESWWIEGDRAFVGVAGVTHLMPMDGDPAANRVTRWSFSLRRRHGVWQIDQSSSSNEDDMATRPWARRWRAS